MRALCGMTMVCNRNLIGLFVCLVLILGACEDSPIGHLIEARSVEKVLSWVDNANPILEAFKDHETGDVKFYQICSFSCVSVGIGHLNGKRCFPQVPHIGIEGTSDIVLSEEHMRLMDVALEFATKYNNKIAHLLRTHGATQCHEDVDWTAAQSSLAEFLESLSDDMQKQGHVGSRLERKDDQADFIVLLPESITEELKQEMCISTKKYLHNELFSIEIRARQDIENVQVIWCKSGKLKNAI